MLWRVLFILLVLGALPGMAEEETDFYGFPGKDAAPSDYEATFLRMEAGPKKNSGPIAVFRFKWKGSGTASLFTYSFEVSKGPRLKAELPEFSLLVGDHNWKTAFLGYCGMGIVEQPLERGVEYEIAIDLFMLPTWDKDFSKAKKVVVLFGTSTPSSSDSSKRYVNLVTNPIDLPLPRGGKEKPVK